jgi:hypothetical protein
MIDLFRRRPRLPADRRPALERDERVVAWAAVTEGGTVVATNRGLWLPTDPAPPAGPALSPEPASPAGPEPALSVEPALSAEPAGADDPARSAGPARLGWHQIHKAVWSGRELTVTPAEVVLERSGYAVVADLPARTLTLPEPGDLPHQVRARVTGSVAYSEHHAVPGGGVRVAARRVSGVDGLTWTVRFDPGVQFDSPEAEAAIDALVARARETADPTL